MTFYFLRNAFENGCMIGISILPRFVFLGTEYPPKIQIHLFFITLGLLLGKERVIK